MSPALLKLLRNRGLFSHIDSMIKDGVCGGLESVFPHNTWPAWTSLATGVNPGKHGIFNWGLPGKSFLRSRILTSGDIAVKTFYEVLSDQGKKTIVVNLPVSWPPLTKQPMLTSLLTQSEEFVHPPELAERFPVLKEYRVVPYVSSRHPQEFVADVRLMEKIKFESAASLMELEWDFFFVMFNGTDMVSHYAYDRMLEGTVEKEVFDFFGEIDSYVSELVEKAGKEVNVLIMSDHGFRPTKKRFNINEWLAREGYLTKSEEHDLPEGFDMFRRKEQKASRKSGLASRIALSIPLVSSAYRKMRESRRRKRKKPRIGFDPTRTKAHSGAIGLQGIHINRSDVFEDGTVSPEEYEQLRDEIMKKLEAEKDPATGERIFPRIWKKEDLYKGSELPQAPDILVDLHPDYALPVVLKNEGILLDGGINWHDMTGIFIAWGQDIRRDGSTIEDARIVDLAPTILHSLGSGVPDNLDGKVLASIFREESESAKTQVKYIEAKTVDRESERGAEEKIIDRLKTLGYID
jgi:predicted AlkP superfamily phosphohydrolase/phosphomutase